MFKTCKTCGKNLPFSNFNKHIGCKHNILPHCKINMVIDHNHKTGTVRGLLCHNCNLLLGKVRNDFKMLKKAANYLEISEDE